MKAIENLQQLSANIQLLKSHLESLEHLDEQEIQILIIDCLVSHQYECGDE